MLFLLSCTASPAITFDNGASFSIELAQTPEERAQGLMNREHLDSDAGMLFVFDDEQPRTFWMKNTLIPLDMIFLDSDKKVVEIKSDVLPCESDLCTMYSSLPAKYVLELNAGIAKSRGITVGMTSKLT